MSELVFGKYEIQHRIAVGGMGEVFYALQKGVFERPVILKTLLPDLATHEGFIEQFLDEARVAATLNHPNVVGIFEVGLWNGTYLIAMEFIRGRDLGQLLRRTVEQGQQVPAVAAVHIVRDAALGLHHAHVATDADGRPLNIVHRDVSPQNIMVREDGVTKVVDFGIAHAANRATRTATGVLKGKLAYMAPEQVLGEKVITSAADQYALGVVFWELLTGRRLFKATGDLELARKVLTDDVPRPSTLVTEVPMTLDAVVMKMLERNPTQRFASCDAVAMALSQASAGMTPSGESPVALFLRRLGTDPRLATKPSAPNFVIPLKPAGRDSVVTATSQSTVRQRARRRWLVVALAAVVGASLGAVALALRPVPVPVVSSPLPDARTAMVLGLRSRLEALSARDPATAKQVLALSARLGETDLGPVRQAIEALEHEPLVPAQAQVAGLVTLTVVTMPPGAAVRVDGRPLGAAPQVVEVAPGEHYLALEKAGYRRTETRVSLDAGSPFVAEVRLVALAAEAVPAVSPVAVARDGFLSLETTPWSTVSIDGEPAGSTPLFKKRLLAGWHTLVLVNEGSNVRVTRTVEVLAGKTVKLKVALRPEP